MGKNKEFVVTDKLVIINFSELYCKSDSEILSSDCFARVWEKYIDHVYKQGKRDLLSIIDISPKPKEDYVKLFKLLLTFDIDEVRTFSPFYKMILQNVDVLYELTEDFYDYWRRLERYAIVNSKAKAHGVESSNFVESTNAFNALVLKTYRTITQKVLGHKFTIYRQLPAGMNASLLINKFVWMSKDSKYANLKDIPCIKQIIIRPPFIAYSKKNKRTGTYKEVYENPISGLELASDEYYCYPAHVGKALAYIYFHRDYISHGLALCNLFDFATPADSEDKKPDLIYVFGAPNKDESCFFHDKEEDIYIGVAPHDDSIDYFGYMKKMLLTLYNVKMINNNCLPTHGACVNIVMKNGTQKTVVIIGDSGAGKSETLEALTAYAKDDISTMQTIFDDMGTLKINGNDIFAYGTEIGAFVRLDDMASGYAYKEMDRAIFMNPDKVNSRLVIPVATYKQIMKGYKVDLVLYANNYYEGEEDILFFSDKNEAKEVFIKGARKAKGTTGEIGFVETFFANPFGPVQREEQTRKIIDEFFDHLYETKIPVGQINTRLAVTGMEHKGPMRVAEEFFKYLEK